MVPNGWENTCLKNIAKIKSGSTPLRSKQDLYYSKDGTPWIKTLDLNNSDILTTDEKITDLALQETSCSVFPINTVLVAMYGGFNQIGRTGLIGVPSAINQALSALVLNEEKAHPRYVLNYLNGNVKLWKKFAASSRKDPNITREDVCSFEILLPPLPEQRKIAKVLSTWDKAISTTERLIDNSKQQKKALMQQLLTGKKRLLDDSGKPFEGEWEEIKLESIVVRTQLGTTERTKENNDSNIVPLIKMGNLTWGGFSFSKLETVPKSIVDESLILQYGDFLFNTRNTPELVGKSAVWKGQLTEATFDNNINRITFNNALNTDFICFYLNHGKGKATVNSLPAGSTSVAAIYWKDLKNIKVPLPNIEEQTKIVSVLVNADQEIELLEQQLADLKQEKKALMQQLLTGKRRVNLS